MSVRSEPIGEYVDRVATWAPAKSNTDTFRYVDLSSVSQEKKAIVRVNELPTSEAPSRARQLVNAGDVLVSTVRPNLNGVAYVTTDFDGCTASTGFCVLRPREGRLSGRYLFNWVRSPSFVKDMVSKATGASYPAVNDKVVKASYIPLPPLDEQRRIAAILDEADRLRQKRKQAIALLDSLTQSIFLDMFGDPVTNPNGWDVLPMSEFEEFLTSGSRGWAKYYADNGKLFLRIQNLKGGQLSLEDTVFVAAPDNAEAKRTSVRAGDILISITADLGRIAVVPKSVDGLAHINQHIALFRPEGICSEYLAAYLASSGGKRQFASLNRQGVKAGLNFQNIRDLQILIPPAEIQNRYAELVSSTRQRIFNVSKTSPVFDHLFTSLQHRAFTGDL